MAGDRPTTRDDSGSAGDARRVFHPEALRRRNPRAVAMDLLFLFTTAFFAHLFVRGLWPAIVAALPFGLVLYFGWRSSRPFFLAQVLVVAATVAATWVGSVPP